MANPLRHQPLQNLQGCPVPSFGKPVTKLRYTFASHSISGYAESVTVRIWRNANRALLDLAPTTPRKTPLPTCSDQQLNQELLAHARYVGPPWDRRRVISHAWETLYRSVFLLDKKKNPDPARQILEDGINYCRASILDLFGFGGLPCKIEVTIFSQEKGLLNKILEKADANSRIHTQTSFLKAILLWAEKREVDPIHDRQVNIFLRHVKVEFGNVLKCLEHLSPEEKLIAHFAYAYLELHQATPELLNYLRVRQCLEYLDKEGGGSLYQSIARCYLGFFSLKGDGGINPSFVKAKQFFEQALNNPELPPDLQNMLHLLLIEISILGLDDLPPSPENAMVRLEKSLKSGVRSRKVIAKMLYWKGVLHKNGAKEHQAEAHKCFSAAYRTAFWQNLSDVDDITLRQQDVEEAFRSGGGSPIGTYYHNYLNLYFDPTPPLPDPFLCVIS